ncbi:MAG: hypothetical protein M1833_003812 [Piccolia ochrophora]|nr:MAG: hypothetical protein M1833_003812 [Piccolia ochrophora]
MDMMNENLFGHSVNNERREHDSRVVVLPLNLIALIVSHVCLRGLFGDARTNGGVDSSSWTKLRTLPSVTLHSYDSIRYVNGLPEGHGGASPFVTGLNALITRETAGLVRSFRLWGQWKEDDREALAKIGRMPDSAMMLNTMVRAAMSRMEKLDKFSWELDTKMLPTSYQGLASRPSLQSLTIRFPSQRTQSPVTVLPAIPSLKSLKVTDIDPLCYPDDISYLLLHSRKLRHLKLHWSPRMRDSLEPTVNLHTYFGKCAGAQYRLPLQTLGIQNLYAAVHENFDAFIDPDTLEGATMINTFGSEGSSPETHFFDQSWNMRPQKAAATKLKFMRGDGMSRTHRQCIARTKGLKEIYMISGAHSSGNGASPANAKALPVAPDTPDSGHDQPLIALGRDYIDGICVNHGQTLKRLLLSDQWKLGQAELAQLVRRCPNLEQLGLGVAEGNLDLFGLLVPFLPKLMALRILDSDKENEGIRQLIAEMDGKIQPKRTHCEWRKDEFKSLRFVGLQDRIIKVGDSMQSDELDSSCEMPVELTSVNWVTRDAVKHIEIWAMDCMDLL